jgi:rhamnulokinase
MTSASYHLLAFDLGAESGRAILGAFSDRQLTLSEVHRFPNTPALLPDGLHWNVLGLWNDIRNGLGAAVQQTGGKLAGMAMDTWGVDFALLDRNDSLLGNPYHYRDTRTDGILETVFKEIPPAEIYAQTGIQFLQFNSLYQLYSMVLNDSPILTSARTFLTIPDLFNFWLTGRKGCEFTNATTTQCYDPRRLDWAVNLLQRLDIPDSIFPDILQPGSVLGRLRKGIAEEFGCPEVPVILPACHDTGSAVAAVPSESADFAWISSGTWSIVGINERQPVINQQSLDYGLTNEGGVNGSFRLCRNIMGLWTVQETRRTWARQDGKSLSYAEITQMAADTQPLTAIIDPDDHDFLHPGDMPARVAAYCRRTHQPEPQTRGEVVRCLLESLALKYRWTLERLERLHGRRLDTVHIIGGGTQNQLLSQFTANATGRRVIAGPVEATATGNLLVQAVALGRLASMDEAREVVRRSFTVQTYEPDPQTQSAWNDAYEKLVRLMLLPE